MDERLKNLILTVTGTLLIVITMLCLPPLVYLEVSQKGTVSTQLAGLLAIPLAAGAAMIRTAFISNVKEKVKEESES